MNITKLLEIDVDLKNRNTIAGLRIKHTKGELIELNRALGKLKRKYGKRILPKVSLETPKKQKYAFIKVLKEKNKNAAQLQQEEIESNRRRMERKLCNV